MLKLNSAFIKRIEQLDIDGLYGENSIDLDNISIIFSRIETVDSPKYISIYGSITYSANINNRSFIRKIMSCNDEIKLGINGHYYDSSEKHKKIVDDKIKDGYKYLLSEIMWSFTGIVDIGEDRIKDILKTCT